MFSGRILRKLKNIFLAKIVVILLLLSINASLAADITKKQEVVIEQKPTIDEIGLKQEEMRDTIVFVGTMDGSGSGVIIDKIETDTEGIFEYRVITNNHVIKSRLKTKIVDVDSITGKAKTITIDTGCGITTFNYHDRSWDDHSAYVVLSYQDRDLAILSFLSDKELPTARIATDLMLKQVRVFDNVFAVGCQLGELPSPTSGIISKLLTSQSIDGEWIFYGMTAHIAPGSSGGGLFKKYNNHYYLIGIPYSLRITCGGQLIPHLSKAISIITAKQLIDETSATNP